MKMRSMISLSACFASYIYFQTGARAQYMDAVDDWSAGSMAHGSVEIVLGCEGEGCGCTYDKISIEKFTLRKQPSESSKTVGTYKVGTKAFAGLPFSIVKNHGRYIVQKIHDSRLDIPISAEINSRFYVGENAWIATYNGRRIEYDGDALELKEISPTKYETWFSITVGNVHGYSKTFPFKGCLE